MALRKVPAAFALGLLASILAHGGLYGGEHAMGGGYHALLLQAALAGGVGLLVFFGLLAATALARGGIMAGGAVAPMSGFRTALVAVLLVLSCLAHRLE